MLETRIKFTGTLEQDLRGYAEEQYANQRGAVNFIIKQALIKFFEDKVIQKRKEESAYELGKAGTEQVSEN